MRARSCSAFDVPLPLAASSEALYTPGCVGAITPFWVVMMYWFVPLESVQRQR